MTRTAQIATVVRAMTDPELVELHSLAAIGLRHLEVLVLAGGPAPAPVPAAKVFPTSFVRPAPPPPPKAYPKREAKPSKPGIAASNITRGERLSAERDAKVYQAIVSADEALSSQAIAAATGSSVSSVASALASLAKAGRIHSANAGPTWSTRYGVTKAAALEGAEAARAARAGR